MPATPEPMPSAMQVEVTGVQFAWYFRYPGADATFGETRAALVDAGAGNPLGIDPADPHGADDIVSSELVLPAGREVDLRIRSLDVTHGFFVPEMRLKQDAVPGSTLHVHFTPTTPGTYAILCSQLCGMGHYRMQATLRVLPPDQFDVWMRSHESRINLTPPSRLHHRPSRRRYPLSAARDEGSRHRHAALAADAHSSGVAECEASLLGRNEARGLSRPADHARHHDDLLRAGRCAADGFRLPDRTRADRREAAFAAARERCRLLDHRRVLHGSAAGDVRSRRRTHLRLDELSAALRDRGSGAGTGARHGPVARQHRALLHRRGDGRGLAC